MRLSRLILSAALTLAVASTALAQKVKTDYDKNTNFTQYKTFAWIKQPKTTDPLMAQRVVEEVNAALAAKGLQLVTNGNADLAIAAHAATQQEHTLNTFYDGFGGGWGWRRFGGGGFGTATTTDNTYEVGTLVIDMFDAKTKEAIWRGTCTKTLSDNPEKNAKALNEGITKMFKNFPPTAKKT
jgi:uncharacterized protein YkwD